MTNADRAAQMLSQEPLTRRELEGRLGTSQQRVSEILRAVGARVVGYRRAPRQGRPSPVYAIGEAAQASPRRSLGRICSVWELGSRA